MILLFGQGLLAVVAGILLNLTPCVLVAIPLKIRAILNATGEESKQRFWAAAAFLAGSVSLFATLGVFAATLRMSWGFLFQSRLFLALLVLILLLAGLAIFLDVSPTLPQSLYRVRGSRYLEPFLTGLLAGVLATPCTGPFLGGVLAFSVTQPPPVVFMLFILIGFGLALPYLILLLWPALLRRLPSGGMWAMRVKELLGFILWASAVFFAQSLLSPAWARAAWGLWAAGLVLWAGFAWRRETNRRARLFPAVSAAIGLLLLLAGSIRILPASLPWEPDVPPIRC
jgi:thiol:disulfide interchange protein DsbD